MSTLLTGVAIMFSKRAQKKVIDFGSEGERVAYVRLKGPITNLFTIVPHVPHRVRVAPCQDDTLHDLETIIRRVPKGDCMCGVISTRKTVIVGARP